MKNIEQLTADIQTRIRESDAIDELFSEVDTEIYNEDFDRLES